VEAVCVAVPTLLHHSVGLACLRAGVDVLIEKPIAATQEEASELIQAAETAGRLLQVGHIERFNPAFRELRKLVAEEEVVVLEARRHSPNPNRANEVSVVLDLMIHDIDLVLELAASPVVRLAAAGGRSGEGRLITSTPPLALGDSGHPLSGTCESEDLPVGVRDGFHW
jgi:predicted dehydrogenase